MAASPNASSRMIPIRIVFRARLFAVLLLFAGVFFLGRLIVAETAYREGLRWAKRYDATQAYRHFGRAVHWAPWRIPYRLEYSRSAQALAQSATGDERTRLFNESWRQMQELTRRHPKNAGLWKARGIAALWLTQLSGADHREEAGASFQTATALNPSDAEAWASWAQWNQSMGHSHEATEAWRQVLKLDPQNAVARQYASSESVTR